MRKSCPKGYHRHQNPDGSVGGIVSDQSSVSKTAYIGPDVEVRGTSEIRGDSKLLDRVKVTNAFVEGNVVVRDRAFLSGCTLKNNVEIGGQSSISGQGLEISGQTHIRNVSVSVGDGSRMRISGGVFELPNDVNLPWRGSPDLMVRGEYDEKTGHVAVETVRAGFPEDLKQPIYSFPNEVDLLSQIEFRLLKGMNAEGLAKARAEEDKSFVTRAVKGDSQASDRQGP